MFLINKHRAEIPLDIWHQLIELPVADKIEWLRVFESSRKNRPLSYFLLAITFHYVYYGELITQLIFWATLGGCGIWWAIDFFRLPYMQSTFNNKQARDIFNRIKKADPGLNGVQN